MVRYYGHYSNVSRGKRKMQDQDELIPSILEPVESLTVERDRKARLPPKTTGPPKIPEYSIDYSTSQFPEFTL